jgi:hypothetical protein
MKKITLIILILIYTINGFTQVKPFANFKTPGISYDADALIYFANAGITSTVQKNAINTYILGLKNQMCTTINDTNIYSDTSIWNRIDVLAILRNYDTVSALVDLKGYINGSTIGGLGGYGYYDRWLGFTTATGHYINTNYNLSSSARAYTKDNASMSAWFNYNKEGGFAMGVTTGSYLAFVIPNYPNFYYNVNTSVAYISTPNTNSIGNFTASNYSGKCYSYINGIFKASSNVTSVTLPNLPVFIGCVNAAGTPTFPATFQNSLYRMGGAMTSTDEKHFYDLTDSLFKHISVPVVCFGDSYTLGITTGSGICAYPHKLDSLLAVYKTYQIYNCGVGGKFVSNLITDYPTVVRPKYNYTTTNNICIIFGGINDIAYLPATADSTFKRYKRLCLLAKADGWKVISVTLPSFHDESTYEANCRLKYNDSIRINYLSFSDFLADIGADANMGQNGQWEDLTYYQGDVCPHPNNAGNIIMTNIILNSKTW